MDNSKYKILGKKLIEKHPEIAKNLMSKPILLDISHLPAIKKLIEKDERTLQKSQFEKREVVVAVILKLYDPDSLEGYKNMRKGLRTAISTLYLCKSDLISHISRKVNNLLSVYKDFQSDVNYFVETISELFDDY